jgi:hypothetical protein
LYFRALNELGAGRMGAIGNLYSPLVIVLSFAFLGERLRPLQLLGFALVSIGVWVAAWPRRLADDAAPRQRPAHALRGFGLAILAIMLMACSIVLVKRVLEAQPLLWVSGLRMAGAIAAMLLIAAWRGELAQLKPQAPGLNPFKAKSSGRKNCYKKDGIKHSGIQASPPVLCTKGVVTHGQLVENTNRGGPDGKWEATSSGESNEVGIADFLYVPGDLSTRTSMGIPTVNGTAVARVDSNGSWKTTRPQTSCSVGPRNCSTPMVE